MEAIITELLKHAFTGVNIIPTVLLIVMQCYWLIAILGFFDLSFLDMDMDLEGTEGTGLIDGLAVFINIGKVPVALVFSLVVLNFWIIAMLMYFLPIEAGGMFSGIMLLPALMASIYITRLEMFPLKKVFPERRNTNDSNDINHKVLNKRCTLKCDLKSGLLGQAEIEQEGASVVINVKPQFKEDSFKKGDIAFVFKKDEEKDVYYIMNDEFYL